MFRVPRSLFGLWNDQGDGIPTNMIVYWIRLRIYPPSGVNPTATYGPLSNAGATINLPASTGYGVSFNIVGTCIEPIPATYITPQMVS